MILHIFTSTDGYNRAFVNFFKANYNDTSHYFAFRNKGKDPLSDKGSSNIIYIDSKLKLGIFLFKLIKAEHIYFHYFPLGPSLYMWYFFSFLMKKTTWIMWGSDLYYFRDRDKSFRSGIYEFIRKSLIKKVSRIVCFIEGDYHLAKEVYKTKAVYQYAVYPLPVKFYILDKYIDFSNEQAGNRPLTILLGNSATLTNNHLEALDALSRFKNEDIRIVCPLSYGDKEYGIKVAEYGSSIFGNKFEPLTEFLNEEKYGVILAHTDIAVMAHNRQQALGNILSLLYLGKKVYMNSETTSYKQIKNLGLRLNDINNLHTDNFQNFRNFDIENKIENNNIIKQEFSDSRYKEIWARVLFQEGYNDKRH